MDCVQSDGGFTAHFIFLAAESTSATRIVRDEFEKHSYVGAIGTLLGRLDMTHFKVVVFTRAACSRAYALLSSWGLSLYLLKGIYATVAGMGSLHL